MGVQPQHTEVVQTFQISPEGVVMNGAGITISPNIHAVDSNELNATIETLKKENIEATNYIQHIQGQMSSLQHQVVLLENKNSTGNLFYD